MGGKKHWGSCLTLNVVNFSRTFLRYQAISSPFPTCRPSLLLLDIPPWMQACFALSSSRSFSLLFWPAMSIWSRHWSNTAIPFSWLQTLLRKSSCLRKYFSNNLLIHKIVIHELLCSMILTRRLIEAIGVAGFNQLLINQHFSGVDQCLLITVSCRLAFKWHDDNHMWWRQVDVSHLYIISSIQTNTFLL